MAEYAWCSHKSVPCLPLDSRQNVRAWLESNAQSVPCLPLDSRQNSSTLDSRLQEVYHAFLWIQGKTMGGRYNRDPIVYHAFLWIQGKTSTYAIAGCPKCTMPSFGFKAKPVLTSAPSFRSVPCLPLDSRQNDTGNLQKPRQSVPCLPLDSRQNTLDGTSDTQRSVPCLPLDSRQNKTTV